MCVSVCVCLPVAVHLCVSVCVCVVDGAQMTRCIFVSPPQYYHTFHYVIHYVVLCIYIWMHCACT
jgi:hypothetical protein